MNDVLSPLTTCIEAESGTGNRGPQNDANASGGQHVGSFGNSGEFMSYAFNLPTAGSYQLNLRYATAITGGWAAWRRGSTSWRLSWAGSG